jgi:hypothetical protein
MKKSRTDSAITPYSCPIAGRTVYIRHTGSLASDGAVCASIKSVCDNQHQCIAAVRAGCGA